MKVLVIAEHEAGQVRAGSLAALGFARAIAGDDALPESVEVLLVGYGLAEAAESARRYAPVLLADAEALEHPLADRYAHAIGQAVEEREPDAVVAASTTFAKDILPRVAVRFGGAMASDVVRHRLEGGELRLVRPMYAGSVTATVKLVGSPAFITVRPSAYDAPAPRPEAQPIARLAIDAAALPDRMRFEGLASTAKGRPDLTEASVVVSGGRAFKSSEEYEAHVGALADLLGGAAGSSRALVDAGITPNELQVGQTGKVVAPQLYIALGLSGAVQHLAGMKNSKVIVAVNKDADAPIFEVADYGLVGDVYKVVPELIEKIRQGRKS